MITQAGLVIFGLLAVALTQLPFQQAHRYAPICGLISQPFWFAVMWEAGGWSNWGGLALCLVYTGIWTYGLWNHWLR